MNITTIWIICLICAWLAMIPVAFWFWNRKNKAPTIFFQYKWYVEVFDTDGSHLYYAHGTTTSKEPNDVKESIYDVLSMTNMPPHSIKHVRLSDIEISLWQYDEVLDHDYLHITDYDITKEPQNVTKIYCDDGWELKKENDD